MIVVTLALIYNTRFEASAEYFEPVINVFKSMETGKYDISKRKWNFALKEYRKLVLSLNRIANVKVQGLPQCCLKSFSNQLNGLPLDPDPKSLVTTEEFNKIEPKIQSVLFPFQVEGVKTMIGRKGRCLLADDMGLGKTIQSLAVASYFKDDWPLLIITPSSVKMAWHEQIKKWLSDPLTLLVVKTANDLKSIEYFNLMKTTVVLISYDLVSRLTKRLLEFKFNFVILDESHFIKSNLTARAKGCIPLCKAARRVLLLSGTPALNRPNEMFSQIDCVIPSLFNGYFKEFGTRYCDPQVTNFGVNYNGSSNSCELQILLSEKIMLRRMKSQVLSQLPEKRREVIVLSPDFLKKASLKRHETLMNQENLKGLRYREALLQYFHATGKAKVDAIKNYIEDLCEGDTKFLFFAHHSEVLNGVEELLIKKKISYVRIDGKLSSDIKQERATRFQNDESVQVALLSILAAGTGINLTAASLAVFGELFWNPGILLQAENRCHRIGQRDFVRIQYLVAENTADDHIWPMVSNKLEVLSKLGLNKENFMDSDQIRLEASFSEKQQLACYDSKANEENMINNVFEKDFIKNGFLSDDKLVADENVTKKYDEIIENIPLTTSNSSNEKVDKPENIENVSNKLKKDGFDDSLDDCLDWFSDSDDGNTVLKENNKLNQESSVDKLTEADKNNNVDDNEGDDSSDLFSDCGKSDDNGKQMNKRPLNDAESDLFISDDDFDCLLNDSWNSPSSPKTKRPRN